MAFRLVSSGGNVNDPAVVNIRCSGTVHPGEVVEFSRTSGAGVYPASDSSTVTNIFGVCLDYAQGASDKEVRIIPFTLDQIWEADCVGVASTANVGMRFALDRQRATLAINNIPVGTDSRTATAIFRVIAMSSATTGSGKVLGIFRRAGDSGGSDLFSTTENAAW